MLVDRLAHVIYVERTRQETHGIVQFFGAMQFHCLLGKSSTPQECALLGVLDSLTGEETLDKVDPLGIFAPLESNEEFTRIWAQKLFDQVRQMGGGVDLSEIRMNFKPSSRMATCTADIWPHGQIPTSGVRRKE